MANPRYGASLTTEEFVAAITDQPDRAAAAAFAAVILGEDRWEREPGLAPTTLRARAAGVPTQDLLDAIQFGISDAYQAGTLREYNFNPDEPRDEKGRWTKDGAGTSGTSLDPADLLLQGHGKHLVPQSQIYATWTDRTGTVHTESGTTAAHLRAMIGRIRAAGGTIDHLIVKGHGGPEGMTDDNDIGTLVPDPDNDSIISDGHNVAPDLRQITNAQSKISLRGCSTDQAADDTARVLGNGATVSGNWLPSVGMPETTWDASLGWSNHSHPRRR